jgi:hypothetical protein
MEKVTLNNKEQKRLLVLDEVLAGRMTGQEAADMLGLGLRHTRRLIADYRRLGAAALAHGNMFMVGCTDTGDWYQGDFDGESTEEYNLILFKFGGVNFDHGFYMGRVTFEGTVLGIEGTVELLMQGSSPRPGSLAYWVGTWRITGGTGDLENIHGSGSFESNGLLDIHYEGQVHFDP